MRHRIYLALLLLALCAPLSAMAQTGIVEGLITDARTGFPISGAAVRAQVEGEFYTTQSNINGYYELSVPAGTGYPLYVIKTNYETAELTLGFVDIGSRVTVNVELEPMIGTGTLAGVVLGPDGNPVPNASIEVAGVDFESDENGEFSVTLIAGEHYILAQGPCLQDYYESGILVEEDATTWTEVNMVGPDAYPGAHQFGDSGCFDGVIDQADLDMMKLAVIGSPDADYSGGEPPDKILQDLDGDEFVLAGDVVILKRWLAGDFSNPLSVGVPDSIELTDPSREAAGFSDIALEAYVANKNNAIHEPRAGWGVVFEVDRELSTCPAAIDGRPYPTIPGAGDRAYHRDFDVFEYTGLDGTAAVSLNTSLCFTGDRVVVNVFVPGDAETADLDGNPIWGERFPDTLNADESFTIDITGPDNPFACSAGGRMGGKGLVAFALLLAAPLAAGIGLRRFAGRRA